MPRYFFDVFDRNGISRDEVGDDFDRLDEARALAVSLLPDIAERELPDGPRYATACDIRDESGQVVYRCALVLWETWDPKDRATSPPRNPN